MSIPLKLFLGCISLGKFKIGFSSWITSIHFCERDEKAKNGFFRVVFLTPHALPASLRAKSKMAANWLLLQFFSEVLVYHFSKATRSNRVKHFIISKLFRGE